MSSLKDSDEQTSPPATPGSRGVQVASSHFSKISASRGNSGWLKNKEKTNFKTKTTSRRRLLYTWKQTALECGPRIIVLLWPVNYLRWHVINKSQRLWTRLAVPHLIGTHSCRHPECDALFVYMLISLFNWCIWTLNDWFVFVKTHINKSHTESRLAFETST